MGPTALAAITVIVLVAAFVQGTTGVGFALIVAPTLGFLAPQLLPVCLLILMLPLNTYVAWRERKALDRSGASWITFGRFFGTFGGLAILAALPAGYLNVLIGIATVLAAAVTLVLPSFKPGRQSFVAAGIVTGITETATGIGGPPLALVYQHRKGSELRSTIAFCFLVGELISLAVLSIAGRASTSQIGNAVLLLPALVIGAWLSKHVHHRLDGRVLRFCVLIFAIVSGLVLVFRT